MGVHALEALAHCLAPGSELRVFDFDRVGPENLPVQPAYGPDDVGELKAMVISERIAALAPSIDVLPFPVRYEDRPDRLPAPGLRVACPDTFTARRYLNDCSVADGVPLVEAGTSPLVAQQRSYLPGRTACLGHQIPDLEARAAREVDVASCAAEHALTLPGTNAVAGGLLALAALRALDPLRLGAPVAGTTVYDARFAARFGELDRRPLCEHG